MVRISEMGFGVFVREGGRFTTVENTNWISELCFFIERRSCNQSFSQEVQGSGTKLLVGIIVGSLGEGKGA